MFSEISALESKLNIRLVTGEFEIVFWLFKRGATRSRELAQCTKVSIANFQIILRRLKADNIVVSICDEKDRRVRLFDLAGNVRREFEECLERIAAADDISFRDSAGGTAFSKLVMR